MTSVGEEKQRKGWVGGLCDSYPSPYHLIYFSWASTFKIFLTKMLSVAQRKQFGKGCSREYSTLDEGATNIS